jgi:hypothetical protein
MSLWNNVAQDVAQPIFLAKNRYRGKKVAQNLGLLRYFSKNWKQ